MKKYISLLMILTVLFAFTACDVETDEEPGGTAVEKLAGFWTVHVYYSVAEDDGSAPTNEADMENWEWDDLFGESSTIMTHNTSLNTANEIWFDDSKFFGVKVKADADYDNLSFVCDTKENVASEGEIKIIKAKVTLNGTTTPSGAPADAIVVYAKITNNNNTYGLNYFKYEGFRYTGFSDDVD